MVSRIVFLIMYLIFGGCVIRLRLFETLLMTSVLSSVD